MPSSIARRRWAVGRRRPLSGSRRVSDNSGRWSRASRTPSIFPTGARRSWSVGLTPCRPVLSVAPGLLRARDGLSAPGLHGARTPQIHRGPALLRAGGMGQALGARPDPRGAGQTLRAKLKHLAEQGQAFEWSAALCTEWMAATAEEAAVLYVDGHVRVYHDLRRVYPSTTWRASGCAYGPPPTIG